MSDSGERPELPMGWEWKAMGDIAKVVGGSTPKSTEATYWDGDIPWIAVSDLTGYTDKYISRGARSITRSGYESCATQILPTGSVLFSSRAPIGYVAIASTAVCTSQGFKSFVLDDGVDPEYVYWYLKSAKPLAESLASGTTFSELSGKRAARIPIPIPPPEEQGQIVREVEARMATMDTGDGGIAVAWDRLQGLKRSFLASSISESWPRVQLMDALIQLRNGIFVSRPATDPPGIPILRISAVRPLEFDATDRGMPRLISTPTRSTL